MIVFFQVRRSCARTSAAVLPATEPMLEVGIEHRLGTFALEARRPSLMRKSRYSTASRT